MRRKAGTGSMHPSGYHIHRSAAIAGGTGKTWKTAHVLIAEKALGKPLPEGALVHHGNGDKLDNRNDNLVICPNDSYHQLLHVRMRALDACGNANWRKCVICKQYDSPENMMTHVRRQFVHQACRIEYMRAYNKRTRCQK